MVSGCRGPRPPERFQELAVPLTGERRVAARSFLELKLHRVVGDEFQRFFADVMHSRHGDGFVGSIALKGDLTCDGMTLDPLVAYGCYGPRGGGPHLGEPMNDVVGKVIADYVGACNKWPEMVE
jgi:hypothetical protein